MNKSKFYLLKHTLLPNSDSSGFTLIELLVVVIILGILAAVAVPNFLNQVGKSREVEIQNTLGTINRAQQAYHFERQVFVQGANDTESLERLGVSIDNIYIDAYNIVDNGNSATTSLVNNQFSLDGTRAYSGGMFFNAGIYQGTSCRSVNVLSSIPAPTSANDCGTHLLLN